MSKALLLDVRGEKYYRGDTRGEICMQVPGLVFDFETRTIIYKEWHVLCAYTKEWTYTDLYIDFHVEAIDSLVRNHGFIFYRNDADI